MSLDERETHYLLVIHGTFANQPPAGESAWYHPADDVDNFCRQLAERLRDTSLEGAVWRSYKPPFWHWWPGENDHMARKRAGKRLAEEIAALVERDPTARVHLVAHSHGGNVVLSALDHYLQGLQDEKDEPPTGEGPQGLAASRIGGIVFLGTPFLKRRWDSTLSVGEAAAKSFVAAVILGALVGAALVVGAVLLSPLPAWTFFEALRPWEWNPWVLAAYGALVLAGGIWIGTGSAGRKDSNVYLDELFFEKAQLPAIEMLVIHSGELDEALTLLSATPAVDAVSDPVVHEIAGGLVWSKQKDPEVNARRAGEPPPLLGPLKQVFGGLLYFIVQIIYLVIPPLARLLVGKIKTRLKGLVLKVFEAEALGLTAHELEDCRIEVSETLELDLRGPRIRSEDVSDLLVDQPAKSADSPSAASPRKATGAERRQRFDYLWDSEALEEAIGGSAMWRDRIEKRLDQLEKTYGGGDPRFVERLQRRVLTIERRWHEVSAGVSLDHSGYYEVPEVINRIAAFLARPDIKKRGQSPN